MAIHEADQALNPSKKTHCCRLYCLPWTFYLQSCQNFHLFSASSEEVGKSTISFNNKSLVTRTNVASLVPNTNQKITKHSPQDLRERGEKNKYKSMLVSKNDHLTFLELLNNSNIFNFQPFL